MCGINGLIGLSHQKSKIIIERMNNALKHRGPNGQGIYIDKCSKLVFGHTRLSILELSDLANQPMVFEETGDVLVYNGEIYNHQILRVQLEKEGMYFKSINSDTEVLLNALVRWGIEKTLRKLNGMFAFAFYSKSLSKVFIARDRIGIKQLYFCLFNGFFCFSSEIKAIKKANLFSLELNLERLSEYLRFRYISAPNTMFKNIFKVRAGSYLVIDTHTSSISKEKQFWEPTPKEKPYRNLNDASEDLAIILRNTFISQTDADVDVGLFLSGGLDSGMIANALSGDNVKNAFTASFKGHKDFDEYSEAKLHSLSSGIIQHRVDINPENLIDDIKKMVWAQDEPIAAPVCLPVLKLAERARNKKTPVILTGEGADEIFMGYDSWKKLYLYETSVKHHLKQK